MRLWEILQNYNKQGYQELRKTHTLLGLLLRRVLFPQDAARQHYAFLCCSPSSLTDSPKVILLHTCAELSVVKLKCQWATGLNSQMELLAKSGTAPVAWLPPSSSCPLIKSSSPCMSPLRTNVERKMNGNFQPHKPFRCRFAADVIKGFNNME